MGQALGHDAKLLWHILNSKHRVGELMKFVGRTERERSIKVLEAIVTYGAPPVAGNYIAPVTRYVGRTVGDGGGCCKRGAIATWGKTYAL